jgi:hypothetical protein
MIGADCCMFNFLGAVDGDMDADGVFFESFFGIHGLLQRVISAKKMKIITIHLIKKSIYTTIPII